MGRKRKGLKVLSVCPEVQTSWSQSVRLKFPAELLGVFLKDRGVFFKRGRIFGKGGTYLEKAEKKKKNARLIVCLEDYCFLCIMGKFSEQIEIKKESKEKDKVRRDKLASYFFDLSKLSFAGLVIGVVLPLFTNVGDVKFWSVALLGMGLTIISALVGNKILK